MGAMLRMSPRTHRSHSREHDQLSLARNWSTSLTRPSWSETSPPGCDPAAGPHPDPLAGRPLGPPLCRRRLRIIGWRWRDCAGTRTSRPGSQVIGGAAGWHERPASADGARPCAPVASPCGPALHTTHIVRSFRSLPSLLTTLFLIVPTLLTREPLQRGNKGTHNMALCVRAAASLSR